MNATRAIRKKKELYLFAIAGICVSLGAMIRIVYILKQSVQPRDAYLYEEIIAQWETTGNYFSKLKVFPLSLWIMKIPSHFFDCSVITGGVLTNIILGLLIIILSVYTQGHYFKNNTVALIAGLLATTHPELVYYSCSCLRENTYLFFAFLSATFCLKYSDHTRVADLLTSAVFGALAFLCRLEGLEFVVIFNIILLYLVVFKKMRFFKAVCHSLAYVSTFVLSSVVVCYSLHFGTLTYNDVILKFSF